MKKIILALLLLATSTPLLAQNITLVLVRHSLKDSIPANNPNLSPAGRQHAQNLAQLLGEIPFDAAFSTPVNRTQQTIQPITDKLNLSIRPYAATDINSILKVCEKEGLKTVLIAAHSNTLHQLINPLVPCQKIEEIPETEYGKIFIINYSKTQSKLIILNGNQLIKP